MANYAWLIGLAGLTLTLFGGVMGWTWKIWSEIQRVDRDHAQLVGKLHERINRTREEYVRRDDMSSHIERIERSLGEMTDEQRRTNDRIDKILAVVVKTKT